MRSNIYFDLVLLFLWTKHFVSNVYPQFTSSVIFAFVLTCLVLTSFTNCCFKATDFLNISMQYGKKPQDKSDGMEGPERVSAELQSMELNHGQVLLISKRWFEIEILFDIKIITINYFFSWKWLFFYSLIFFSFKFYFLCQINFFQFRAFFSTFFHLSNFWPWFCVVGVRKGGGAWAGRTLMIDSRCHTCYKLKMSILAEDGHCSFMGCCWPTSKKHL